MSTHNLCFEQKNEKCQNFLPENFRFLEMKFSIYLYRCVFVMRVLRFINGLPYLLQILGHLNSLQYVIICKNLLHYLWICLKYCWGNGKECRP